MCSTDWGGQSIASANRIRGLLTPSGRPVVQGQGIHDSDHSGCQQAPRHPVLGPHFAFHPSVSRWHEGATLRCWAISVDQPGDSLAIRHDEFINHQGFDSQNQEENSDCQKKRFPHRKNPGTKLTASSLLMMGERLRMLVCPPSVHRPCPSRGWSAIGLHCSSSSRRGGIVNPVSFLPFPEPGRQCPGREKS